MKGDQKSKLLKASTTATPGGMARGRVYAGVDTREDERGKRRETRNRDL